MRDISADATVRQMISYRAYLLIQLDTRHVHGYCSKGRHQFPQIHRHMLRKNWVIAISRSEAEPDEK